MNPSELGRRIKEARINKKMTQAELVGDFITRNMLSRIESGNATPSVKTLEYIASKLEVSVSSLVPEALEQPIDLLTEAKTALKSGDYKLALDSAESIKEILNDEYAAISCIAHIKMARNYEKENKFSLAYSSFNKAISLADTGIYANKALKSEAAIALLRLSKYADRD